MWYICALNRIAQEYRTVHYWKPEISVTEPEGTYANFPKTSRLFARIKVPGDLKTKSIVITRFPSVCGPRKSEIAGRAWSSAECQISNRRLCIQRVQETNIAPHTAFQQSAIATIPQASIERPARALLNASWSAPQDRPLLILYQQG